RAGMSAADWWGVNVTGGGCGGTDGGRADSAPVHIGRSAVGSRWTVPRGPNVLTRVRSSQSARCTSLRVAPAMRRPIENSAALSTWACAPHSTPAMPAGPRAEARGRLGQRRAGHPPGRDAAPGQGGRSRRLGGHERVFSLACRASQYSGQPQRDLPRWRRGGWVVLPEPELVAMWVAAGREPAHARNRGRLVRLAPQLPDARGTLLDVVPVEVGARAALARLHVGDRQAPLVADLCCVVLEGAGIGLELPPEQAAPKVAALRSVVGGDLEVHYLTRHGPSPM